MRSDSEGGTRVLLQTRVFYWRNIMAKTLETIRTQVRSYLDEDTAADWTDPELNVLVNTYYHHVYSAVVDVFEEYAPLKTDFLSTVANQQEYSLPSDFFKIRRVEIDYDTANTDSIAQRAIPINMDAVRRDLGNENLGVTIRRGSNYYLRGNQLGFVPVPDQTGTNAIKIWYYPVQSDMTTDATTIDLPYPDRDWILIAWGAAAEALAFGQQETAESSRLERKYEKGIEMMKQRLEDRITDETKIVVDSSGENVDFESHYSGF